MKKIIYTIIAGFFGVALFATSANAQAVFNSPGEMPTVTITNSTRNACSYGPINGCWQASTTASAGDVVAVHIYYKNTSNTAAQGTTLGLSPQSTGATTSTTFSGGVASLSGPRATGTASVSISSSQSLSYIEGSGKWYPSATSGTRPVDSGALFGRSGFNVGTVNPGEQGVLVAFFKVSNNIDIPTENCVVNSFYANPTVVASGGQTTLSWSTTGCDSLTIDGVVYPVNGSSSFGPIYSSRSYDLRATRGSSVATRQAYVSVNQIQNPTYACNDGRDNDGDGLIDYPADPGCSSYTDNDEYNQVIVQNTRPQAVTTVATILGQTTARLNGIAVPNSSSNTTSWFEWGTSNLFGSRTNPQITNSSSSTYYSDSVVGLVPDRIYYYRAVVQNQNGIAYGDTVRFQTQKATVVVNTPTPTRVITKVVTQRDTVVVKSTASLLELRVENIYDRMCIDGEMDYTVSYRNISGQTLQNAVLRISHPKELTFINSSRGNYEIADKTVTIALGDIKAGEQGTVQVRARVNSTAVRGNLAVTTATVVYTNTISRAQEDAIAYSLITVSDDCPNVLGASAFGAGSFFPRTLVGWLLLILVILALIVLGRQLYKKREA